MTYVDPKISQTHPSVATLMHAIESHCVTTAIATLFPDVGGAALVELQRRHTQVIFSYGGATAGVREWFVSHLAAHHPSRLVIRSLTTETDPATQLRVKELHGYAIHPDRFSKVGADELARFWCSGQSIAAVARVEAIRFC